MSSLSPKGIADGCVLDFGPPTFSAGVVYRRAMLACHSGVVYELQGNNRNSGALEWPIIRSQESWVKGWFVYRRFIEHGPKQSEMSKNLTSDKHRWVSQFETRVFTDNTLWLCFGINIWRTVAGAPSARRGG